MEKMKAVICTKYGAPEVLKLVDVKNLYLTKMR